MSDGDDWDASDSESATAKGGAASKAAPPALAVTARKGKYADEEDDDTQVKDSWEDSDEEAPAPTTSAPSGPIRQKGITKAKIAAREAEEAAKLAEQQERASEDPAARKQREMKLQMASDLEAAKSLFAGTGIAGGSNGVGVESDNPLAAMPKPKTKEDFEQLSDALAKQITDLHGSKPLYPHFVEHLIRQLAMPLKDLDVKKCSSTLAALGNEKQRQAKDATGTGKKGAKGKAKPSLGAVATGTKGGVTGRGYAADLDAHTAPLDDEYDDFM